MRLALILALGCVALSGCAATQSGLSHADASIVPADARALAVDAARHLESAFPPAKTTLVLYPSASTRQSTITDAFAEALRATGFGVLEAPRRKGEAMPLGVPLRYRISPLDAGILLRLEYQNAVAARFYTRAGDNVLYQAAPFTVRNNVE